jgi:hypothetical protein
VSEWREYRELAQIEKALNEANDRLNSIEAALADQSGKIDQLLQALVPIEVPATAGKISQIEGESQMAITGTKVGGSSVFQVSWNGGMKPGAPVVWSADDPGISFAPVAVDPTGNTVTATDVAADTLTQYVITVKGTASDDTAVSATATIPLLTAPATGGTINQVS